MQNIARQTLTRLTENLVIQNLISMLPPMLSELLPGLIEGAVGLVSGICNRRGGFPRQLLRHDETRRLGVRV